MPHVSQTDSLTLNPLEDEAALGWLSERLGQRTEWSIIELTRQFGWPRKRLLQRLAVWTESGRITQRPGKRGRVVIERALDRSPFSTAEEDERSRRAALRVVVCAMATTVQAPVQQHSAQQQSRPVTTMITAAVLVLTAIGLTGIGLVINARFSASLGQTIEAAVLLALIGLAIDVLAVVLPTVAAQLWHRRLIAAAATAWTIWLAALTMTMLAATGFASTQIGDAIAGRATIAGERSALGERIARLRRERAGIAETRAAAVIEIELQRAQPGAQAVWAVTSGCRDVTRAASARACASVLELREALANAHRRDAVDAELRAAETRLAALPTVATADPQTKMAAEIVAWLTAGHVRPTPQDVSWLRTMGLALAPSLAGLIGLLALLLVKPTITARVRQQKIGGGPAVFSAEPPLHISQPVSRVL